MALTDFYSFGGFQLAADGTLLLRNGVVVPLAPKVLQTLLLLVQRAGTVVRKAELMAAIWPDSFVEDTGGNSSRYGRCLVRGVVSLRFRPKHVRTVSEGVSRRTGVCNQGFRRSL